MGLFGQQGHLPVLAWDSLRAFNELIEIAEIPVSFWVRLPDGL